MSRVIDHKKRKFSVVCGLPLLLLLLSSLFLVLRLLVPGIPRTRYMIYIHYVPGVSWRGLYVLRIHLTRYMVRRRLSPTVICVMRVSRGALCVGSDLF